jgi:hypothetical protein
MTRLLVAFLGAFALLGGCASTDYVYRPTAAAAPETGYTVARYGVPPEAPRGEVYVTSYGVTKVDVAPDTQAAMLHVRMGISNTSGTEPWTADAREQQATVPGRGRVGPTYANSDAGGPLVTVPQGQQRVLDLYYALPAGHQDERNVPGFDLSWTVRTGSRTVAQQTPFARGELPAGTAAAPPPPFVAIGLGWGPYWWYDPLWPYPSAVIGFRPLIVRATPPFRGVRPTPPTRADATAPRSGLRGRPVAPAAGWRGRPPAR